MLLIIIALMIKKIWLHSLLFMLIGFLWATNAAIDYLGCISQYIDQKLMVTAIVKSINIHHIAIDDSDVYIIDSDKVHPARYVNFNIIAINNDSINTVIPISLLWKDSLQPLAGETWQLTIKTKVVHSYLNEGSFDSQRFAISNRKLLAGSIEKAELIASNVSIRQQIVNTALPHINHFEYGDIMLALAFGERSRLTQDHKNQLFQTGIAHLMAISGMHILLVALLVNRFMRGLQFFLPTKYIRHSLPILISWGAAISYAWLSGFNPPAMRSILALSLWIILRYKQVQLTPWQMINRVIALLLLFDPLMILSESFWLSCYAVMCLIFITQWFPLAIKKTKYTYFFILFRLQLFLTILLMPIQLIIFNGTSGSSLVSNLIAIPIISFVVLPSIMMMLMMSLFHCTYLSIGFGFIAEKGLSWMFGLLAPLSPYWLNIPHAYYLLSGAGWLCLVCWRLSVWRQYFLTIILIIGIMCSPFMKNDTPRWQVDMLDVGHGLAIVIRQGQSVILYDTGDKWQSSSAAERIILPFLKWHNLTVEGIIISHEHSDHIGGLDIILQHYPNAWLMSSTNALKAKGQQHYDCVSDNVINWHDLTLSALWPIKMNEVALNPESCVIRVSQGNFSMLLTGDLERKQEEQLVLMYGKLLFSTILQIPHHGSNTSSFYAFLAHVNPGVSIGSVARYNPWKLPSNKALFRYQDTGLDFVLTSQVGQITISFYNDNWLLKRQRYEIKPRWYHDWFGTLPNYR